MAASTTEAHSSGLTENIMDRSMILSCVKIFNTRTARRKRITRTARNMRRLDTCDHIPESACFVTVDKKSTSIDITTVMSNMFHDRSFPSAN